MILCCGEALIDMIPDQSGKLGSVYSPVVGGSVFNSAVALGRLGVDTGFFTALSRDAFGRQLEHALMEAKVDYSLCHRSELPTTLAFVEFRDGQNHYTFYDEGTAGRLLDKVNLPDLDNQVSCMLFGGISLIFEPCGSAYEELLVRNSDDKVIYLDPNIRSGFITDEQKHRDRIDRMISKADIVKISDEDLDWLKPDIAYEDAIRGWLERGVAIILLTRGEKGVDGYVSKGKIQVGSNPANIIDTVGAGDAFNAGVLSELQKNGLLNKKSLGEIGTDQLRPALEKGNLVASITVSRKGADSPWASEL